MPKRLFLILFAAFLMQSLYGQVSENTRVFLLTCGSGDDLYSTFGHSAIYIDDRSTGLNRVYNYGTFDFDTPNFYLKFTRGQLDYILSTSTFERFVYSYQREGRWVKADEVNLTLEEKSAIYSFLENNALPENRAYKYDFFYDNCSTRIRDVFEEILGDKLEYPKETGANTLTFRDMLDQYLTNHPWSDLGIDLALGLPCDRIPLWRDQMFLPDYLKAHLSSAKVKRNSNLEALFIGETQVLEGKLAATKQASANVWIFWVIFGIAAISSLFLKGKVWKWFDLILFSSAGVLGIFILLLWFATDHGATKWNLNVVWALPSWLYGSYLILKGRISSSFFKVHAMAMLALVVFWMLIPQNFHAAVVPLILALGARAWASQKRRFELIAKSE
jgi:hypothetical protein